MKFIKITLLVCLFSVISDQAYFVLQATEKPQNDKKTVNIGLLIPDKNSIAAQHGAELAIQEANIKGGYKGTPFQLVVKSMEGPWGTGSKMAVDEIFNDKVWAILGSHDGRNAHLVEQVCTKVRYIMVSAWAGDPTLARAFVPWYFSCVPNDYQQADAIIDAIFKENHKKTVLISDNGYDSKLAMTCYIKELKAAGKSEPVKLIYDESSTDFSGITDQIAKSGADAAVLFGGPNASASLLKQIQMKKINIQVFGTLSLFDENEFSGRVPVEYENLRIVSSVNLEGKKGSAFKKAYHDAYGKDPGAVASYAYDGMGLLLEAISAAGSEYENIQKKLQSITYQGVTGIIQFDEKGNRKGNAGLIKIKDGNPVNTD